MNLLHLLNYNKPEIYLGLDSSIPFESLFELYSIMIKGKQIARLASR